MMNFLLRLLPADMKQLLVLGQSVLASMDTAEERREAMAYAIAMLADGKVTPGEWSQIGSRLGILRAPRKGRPPGIPKFSDLMGATGAE
jgi:hypothetical protein